MDQIKTLFFDKISSLQTAPDRRFHKCLVLILGVFALISCEEEKSTNVHIEGRIVNAHNPYLVITNYADLNDTLTIDDNGKFEANYERLEKGLYTIIHPAEHQSVYIEPGDSIKLRLNTKAFDETLAFTGDHGTENNFLINEFIAIENDNRSLMDAYKLAPEKFLAYIDSVLVSRISTLDKVAEERDFCIDFVDHMKAVYELNSWSRLERYPATHYGRNNILESRTLPENFFQHRSKDELNDPQLLNNYSFRPYLRSLINNKTMMQLAEKSNSGQQIDRDGYDFTKTKLEVLWKTISNPTIRNLVATAELKNYIRTRKNATKIYELIAELGAMTQDQELTSSITDFASTYIRLESGNQIPNINLITTYGNEVRLDSVIEDLAVLFFWSYQDPAYTVRVHNEVRNLRQKYPEIQFIGLNIDDTESELWQDATDKFEFDRTHEFQLKNTTAIVQSLALKSTGRSMVVNKDLTIIDPDLNLFYYQIENVLLGYLNR